ncbi:MAG TPA: ankyrin repeat domain-containing protein, partial [Haloferula sp.]
MPPLEELLWNAAWNDDLAAIGDHLEQGAAVDGRSFNNSSPLEAAAYNGQAAACDLLLQSGANPNATHAPTGETVLHQAITKAG